MKLYAKFSRTAELVELEIVRSSSIPVFVDNANKYFANNVASWNCMFECRMICRIFVIKLQAC